ncbi:MAG: type II toxin-antitoxin system RelE/ParE family toxin [Methylococcales bacterium]
MLWTVKLSKTASKSLERLDKRQRDLVWGYIKQTLPNQANPRSNGKALQGGLKGLWRYRVGDYRLICNIQDQELIILVIEIGRRKNIYQ